MPICEPRPFMKGEVFRKSKGPSLRYEVGVSISRGKIVWIHGSFPCGSHPEF